MALSRIYPTFSRETDVTRMAIPAAEQAPSASRPLLDPVEKQLGIVPNLMKLVGNSPAALEGPLSLNGAPAKGSLGAKTNERIARAISEFNACGYCPSARSYLARNPAKLDDAEIAANGRGESNDAKANAAVRFAMCVAQERGYVSYADLRAVKAAAYTNGEIVEI